MPQENNNKSQDPFKFNKPAFSYEKITPSPRMPYGMEFTGVVDTPKTAFDKAKSSGTAVYKYDGKTKSTDPSIKTTGKKSINDFIIEDTTQAPVDTAKPVIPEEKAAKPDLYEDVMDQVYKDNSWQQSPENKILTGVEVAGHGINLFTAGKSRNTSLGTALANTLFATSNEIVDELAERNVYERATGQDYIPDNPYDRNNFKQDMGVKMTSIWAPVVGSKTYQSVKSAGGKLLNMLGK